MSAVMIEFEVLAAAPHDDARAAVERMGGLGPVILLVAAIDTQGVESYAGDERLNVTPIRWSRTGGDRRPSSGHVLDQAAATRLAQIQVEHGAGWLIASETTLAVARACPGLRVICVGPAENSHEPTRPDHRAHDLLDAVRFIETAEAFA